MKRGFLISAALGALMVLAGTATAAEKGGPDWAMNATVIEACSCPMFCQCYFNKEPAAHSHGGHGEHFCRFNNVYKVNKGHYGGTKLDGAKFWLAGDLGAEFGDNEMDWHVLTFDKSVGKEQRDAIGTILGHLFPVKWKSTAVAEGDIEWKFDKDSAHAALDGGKTAEVKLVRFPGMTNEPVVIQNLKYWGAPRNDGFILMPNQVEAYRTGDKAFEYKGTNGFMVTFDITSKDVAAAPAAMAR